MGLWLAMTTWDSGRVRWKRLRRAVTARGPALKQGQPLFCIISTSRMMRSACLRHARKPWMHSTCSKEHKVASDPYRAVPC